MGGGAAPIRWLPAIVGGIIAEIVTSTATVLVIAVTGHAAPLPGGGIDPAATQISAVIGPVLGSLLCYLAGWWAARQANAHFGAHGAIAGASAAVLTVAGAIAGAKGPAALHAVSAVLKILAGRAGGATAERMAGAERVGP